MKLRKSIALLLAFMLLLSLAACANGEIEDMASQTSEETETSGGETAVNPFEEAKADEPMGAFSLELLSGETFTLAEQEGKAVLINFWATWCGPCVRELPAFQQLQEDYADRLVILAINCADDEDELRSFLEENGYTFQVAVDKTGQWFGFLTNIPYTILVGPDGTVALTRVGGGATAYDDYSAVLDQMF